MPASRKAGKQKSTPEGPKSASRRGKPPHRAAVPSSSNPPAATGTAAASVHPVLGLYVPHARRSYHRETLAKADVVHHHTGLAELNARGMPTAVQAPVKARKAAHSKVQRSTGNAARSQYPLQRVDSDGTGNAARSQFPLQRVDSDSSMTVSANSTED